MALDAYGSQAGYQADGAERNVLVDTRTSSLYGHSADTMANPTLGIHTLPEGMSGRLCSTSSLALVWLPANQPLALSLL